MENGKKYPKSQVPVIILCILLVILAAVGGVAAGRLSGQKLLEEDVLVTVGKAGDYETLGQALEKLADLSPVYRREGVKCEIQIKAGTTIREQITVKNADLRFITITSEDEMVPVDSRGWDEHGLNYHDLRGDVAFLGGEDGAGLPTIGTIFHLVNEGERGTVGYFVNRDSQGILLPGCGFDGFYDGCIANNGSELVMQEGISREMTRWGVYARHGSEIFARNAVLEHCGLSVCADLMADVDVSSAVLSSSSRAILCSNLSRVNGSEAKIYYCTSGKDYIVQAESGGAVNCCKADVQYGHTDVFGVLEGGTIYTTEAKVLARESKAYSQEPDIQTPDGMIYK